MQFVLEYQIELA